jgi:hypothetical protein
MNEVRLIPNGCPICGGDLRGNSKVNYYCKKDNILFTQENLKVRDIQLKIQTLEPKPKINLFIASLSSKVYHSPDCNAVKKIREANKITVFSEAKAKEKGFAKCKLCFSQDS